MTFVHQFEWSGNNQKHTSIATHGYKNIKMAREMKEYYLNNNEKNKNSSSYIKGYRINIISRDNYPLLEIKNNI